jgi:hypothetical protein
MNLDESDSDDSIIVNQPHQQPSKVSLFKHLIIREHNKIVWFGFFMNHVPRLVSAREGQLVHVIIISLFSPNEYKYHEKDL